MVAKDLIILPLGKYELTDGIYDYNLRKDLNQDKSVIYRITEKLTGNSMALFEEEVNVFEDIDLYKRINITSLASVGGLSIHSDNNFTMLWGIKFIPRGSFKKFIEIINK